MENGKDIFWIGFGDIHERISLVRKIDSMPLAQGVLISGDLTNVGGRVSATRIIHEIEQLNPRIFAQIGNMDTLEVDDYLTEKQINAHASAKDLGHGVGLMGVGYSTTTPFHTPSEVSEKQLERWLHQVRCSSEKFDHLILMAHTPPHGTKTDRIRSGQSVGSMAVRRFIEDIQPEVCLTGHIHEAKSEDQIGRTRIVNPGPFQDGGYAVIRLEDDRLTIRLEQVEIY